MLGNPPGADMACHLRRHCHVPRPMATLADAASVLDLKESPVSSINAVGYGGYNPVAAFQQNLFNEIDTSGTGSITKSEVEKAVSSAGGTTQGADALFAQLDPNNTGSVTEQQFSQNLPAPPFSDKVGSQLIGYQASGWPASPGSSPGGQLAQSLFSQIDTSGTGSITKSELEQAVTSAGGTTQGADALYAKLDPNNAGSVSEQQFAQTLSQLSPHHHHGHGGDHAAGAAGSQDPIASLLNASGGAGSPPQLAQTLFSQIDTSGTGSITKSQLETAVSAAGGTTQGADALYAQLDPNNTGSVSEQQFAQYLAPPSATGNTAQDALLALIQSSSNAASTASSTGVTGATGVAGSPTGNTAQDALLALIQSSRGATSTASASSAIAGPSPGGTTAQDAVLALIQGLGSSGGSSGHFGQGNSAQDAVWSLIQSFASTQYGSTGASQDPLMAMMNGVNDVGMSALGTGNTSDTSLFSLMEASSTGSANGNGSSGGNGTTNSANLALALSLYQSQMNQQMLSGIGV